MPDNHIFVYKSQLEVYFWVSLVAPASAGDSGSISGSGRSPGEGLGYPLQYSSASLVAQLVKNLPEMCDPWVRSLG